MIDAAVPVVLSDASVLWSRTLRDYFAYSAKVGAIEIRWSQEILDEMSRSLRLRIGMSQHDTDVLEIKMTDNTKDFPRHWMAENGVELVDSATLIERIAVE